MNMEIKNLCYLDGFFLAPFNILKNVAIFSSDGSGILDLGVPLMASDQF